MKGIKENLQGISMHLGDTLIIDPWLHNEEDKRVEFGDMLWKKRTVAFIDTRPRKHWTNGSTRPRNL